MGIVVHTNVITVLLAREIKYTIETSNRLYYVVHLWRHYSRLGSTAATLNLNWYVTIYFALDGR